MTRSGPPQRDTLDEAINIKRKFRCPKCARALDGVLIYSEAYQMATIERNRIVGYGQVEHLTEAKRR